MFYIETIKMKFMTIFLLGVLALVLLCEVSSASALNKVEIVDDDIVDGDCQSFRCRHRVKREKLLKKEKPVDLSVKKFDPTE